MEINKIYHGHTLDILKTFPDESIDMCVTSPPYWGLRDYGLEPIIWDGDPNCQHNFEIKKINTKRNMTYSERLSKEKNKDTKLANHNIEIIINQGFCSKCGAWKGSLGLEPDPNLYIKHLCDIFDEVKRVLKKEGTCWVNLGDTYASGNRAKGGADINNFDPKYKNKTDSKYAPNRMGCGITDKSLCQIPSRFAIAMTDPTYRGLINWVCAGEPQGQLENMIFKARKNIWYSSILRNEIIWFKPNCMPSSAKDRFTVDFEKIFFFVKSSTPQYWTNKKTMRLVTKKPLGIKGIEGQDWEWNEIGNNYSESNTKISKEESEKFGSPRARVYRIERLKIREGRATNNESLNNRNFMPINKKQKKVSLWESHDYYFETQYESYDKTTIPRMFRGVSKKNKWINGPDGQSKHTISQPRENQTKYFNENYGGSGTSFKGHKGYFKADGTPIGNPQGRNKRCVWRITTKPYKEAHFATFPPDLIETPIKAGCPEFVCTKCGNAKIKVYKREAGFDKNNNCLKCGQSRSKHHQSAKSGLRFSGSMLEDGTIPCGLDKEIGYTSCNCGAEFKGGIVLDPFIGSGTTAGVALKQRKNYIGIEANPEYIKLAEERFKNVQQELL